MQDERITQQFSISEQRMLIRKFDEQFGIRAALNKDKQYARIRLAVPSIGRLYAIVKPYLLPMFGYKFPS